MYGTTGTSPGSPGSPGNRSTLTPEQWVTALLAIIGAARQGKKWQCPGHGLTGEHTVSLTLGTGNDGRVLLYCHAGCTWRDVFRALKLSVAALTCAPPTDPARHARTRLRGIKFPPAKAAEGGSPEQRGYRFESEHPYGDDVWLVRLRHRSSGAKEITWESRNLSNGERVPGLMGRRTADLPLYCEREVRMAVAAGEPVLLAESESSVDALRKAGHYATTWAGGAGSPNVARLREVLFVQDEDGGTSCYPHLVVIPDVDDAGIECLRKLHTAGLVPHLLNGERGEDAKDLLHRVGPDAFRSLITEALA